MLSISTSTRADGSMKIQSRSDAGRVREARQSFLAGHDVAPKDTTLVHMTYDDDNYTRYHTIDDGAQGDGLIFPSTFESDGLVVTKLGHALFLPLADCVGAIIHDPTKGILMLSHLGRHNLEQFGGTKSIEYLVREHGIDPQNLTVWLSPAAGKDYYPLYAFNNRSLHDVAIEQLTSAGVLQENIEVSSIDSAADRNYYSHSEFLKGNRDEDGRFAVVAMMTL